MIKNILLPEKYGSYYLFAKRIVGFEITKTHLFATVVYLHGRKATIEQCLEIPIEQDNGETLIERTATAITKALSTIGKYSEIHVALSSAQAIFKTMKLPFESIEKIKKVIDFEVEPLLPFSIADAVIDFIITKQIPDEKSSEVLVAAVQKQYITQQLELYSQVGVQPTVITIDIFELYGFYKQIPYYADLSGGVTLLDIGNTMTKIAYILDGQLRFIRNLSFGMTQLAKSMATSLNVSPRDALEDLLRFGFDKIDSPEYTQALQQACESFVNNVRFTLQSFTVQTEPDEELTHIFLLGTGANIKGLAHWMHKTLNVPSAQFNPTEITKEPNIALKKMLHIPIANTISTSIALPSQITDQFNLRQKEFAPSDEPLLLKQLLVAGTLILTLFCALFIHSYLQVRTLRNEMQASQNETLELLKEWFPKVEEAGVDDMIEDAQKEVKKEEKLWFSFAKSARTSFLYFLLELTRLDREGLGLIVEKITIDQDRGIMTLKAQVKDTQALGRLENELRQSELFTYVPILQTPQFTMELRFATGPEENA